jgi:hypothetical protein
MKHRLPTPGWQRTLLWAVAAVVLAAVFAAYLSPHMVVDLAARVWSCF